MEEQMKSDEMEIDLVELFHTLVKKAWVILICLLVGAIIAGGYTKLFITPQYQASSTIYVLGNAGQSSNVSVSLSLSKQLTVDFTILSKSRPVIEKVIDKLGFRLFCRTVVRHGSRRKSIGKQYFESDSYKSGCTACSRYLKRDVRCYC